MRPHQRKGGHGVLRDTPRNLVRLPPLPRQQASPGTNRVATRLAVLRIGTNPLVDQVLSVVGRTSKPVSASGRDVVAIHDGENASVLAFFAVNRAFAVRSTNAEV